MVRVRNVVENTFPGVSNSVRLSETCPGGCGIDPYSRAPHRCDVHVPFRSFPNAVGKLSGKKLLGQEIQDVQDVSSLQLKRPVDRGYVVNWDLQKEIWGHGFKNLLKEHESVRGKISGIVVSEPVRCHVAMLCCDEVIDCSFCDRRLPDVALYQDEMEDPESESLLGASNCRLAAGSWAPRVLSSFSSSCSLSTVPFLSLSLGCST